MPKYTKKDKQQNIINEIYLRSDIQPYTKRTTLDKKLQSTKQNRKPNIVSKSILLRDNINPYAKGTTLETKLQQMDAKNIFNANELSIAKKEHANQTLSTIEQINNNIDDEKRMKEFIKNLNFYVETHQPTKLQAYLPREQNEHVDKKELISKDSSKFLMSPSKVAKIGESADSLPSKLSGFSNQKKIEVKKSTKRSFKDKCNNNQNIDGKRRRVNNKTIFIKTPEDSKQSGCCCF